MIYIQFQSDFEWVVYNFELWAAIKVQINDIQIDYYTTISATTTTNVERKTEKGDIDC